MHKSFQEQSWERIYETQQQTAALKAARLKKEEEEKRLQTERAQGAWVGSEASGKEKSGKHWAIQALEAGKIEEEIADIFAKRAKGDDPLYGEERIQKLRKEQSYYREGLPEAREYESVVDRYTSRDFYKTLLFSFPLMDDPMATQLGAGLLARPAAMIPVVGIPIALGLQGAGIGAATHMESKDEASFAYQEAFEKAKKGNLNDEEAHRLGQEAYDKAYKANLALLGATNTAEQAAMFFNPASGVGAKVLARMGKTERAIKVAEKALARAEKAATKAEKLKTAGKLERAAHTAGKIGKEAGRIGLVGAIEAPQEMAQQVISQWATGDEIDFRAPEVKEAGWAGFTMGVGLGGAGRVASKVAEEITGGSKNSEDPHGVYELSGLVRELKGLSPTDFHGDIGVSGEDLDTRFFPRISAVDPIIEKPFHDMVLEGMSDDRKTTLNNKVRANMESGMDEQDATFKALDDMMLYDNDFHDMVQGAFLKVSQDYQVQIEEMHDRFSVYFAVLEKLPQEAQQTLEEQTKAMKEETGDDIGLASFDTVMSTYLNTPDGAAVLENIGLQDGSFWRKRVDSQLNQYVAAVQGLPFENGVSFIEDSVQGTEGRGLDSETVAEIIFRANDGDPNKGADMIDALYYRENIDRNKVNEIVDSFSALVRQERPEIFSTPSAREQEIERGMQEVEYGRRLNKHSKFGIKHDRALKTHTPEQQESQRILQGAMDSYVSQHPRLSKAFEGLTGERAFVVTPSEEQKKVQNLIKKAFGHDVVFFEANPLIEEYGAPSGVYNKKSGTIFVNINSDNPMLAIIGHELAHAMSLDKTFNKKFFNDFLAAVQEAGIKDAEYVQGLFEMLDAGVDISPEFYEIAGDVMGEAINSEAFWQNLHKKSPRAFEQLFNELKKIVSELKALFTGVAPEHDMRRMFHEADALIAMAENVAREYAKHRQSKAVVRTHSEAKRQTFFVYDKDTDKPIWKAGTPGAAGREGALEVARRINEGEATVDDIVAEHGVIEPVRRRGETDKKIAKDKAATDAFAAGTIHLDPRGDKITVLEQKEKTVKAIKTEKEGSKPYWISKEHLTPVEETPVEETPVEETPAEETPVEETPVEDTPVEDTPVEDTPVEDTPVESKGRVKGKSKGKKSNLDALLNDAMNILTAPVEDNQAAATSEEGGTKIPSQAALNASEAISRKKIGELEALLDDDFEFQSMRRDFPFYERAKAVLEKNYRDALPELEKVKDDPDAIRDLVRKHVAKEREKLERVEELKAQRAAMQAPENRVAKKSREILAANKAKRMINAEQFEKVKQTFEAIREAVDSGVKLNEAQLETLEKVFAGYNEAMAPMSLEDSVPVRVLKRLGLELDMGIDYRYNHLEREYQLKYYWSVSGNIATYGHELYQLGARYNEVSRSYEWISDDPSDSPLSTIMDRFGGEEYVEEARNQPERTGKENERGAITGLVRRSDVTRLTGTYYKTGTEKSAKQLYVTKGVRANQKTKIRASKKSWDILEEHQKDGVNLAIQALDTHNAFVLADGTGAGKTAQMLTVAEHYSRAGEDVLIVVDTEKTFREAFVRDAKMLGIPVNKLNFIPAKKDTSKIGKMSKGKINVIAYNYFSLGNVPIISKLGTVPNLVIFDEAHNLKNVLQTTGEATKSSVGTELSLAADKSMFVTATVAETGEQLLYLEKVGFLDHYKDGLSGFMRKMGYYFVKGEDSKKDRWFMLNDQFTSNQMDLLYHELTDAGLFLKRELKLDGVAIGVREYTIDDALVGSLDRVANLIETHVKSPLSKAHVLMAQRRYLETQKIQEIYNVAVEELEKGRQVIIFAGQVNPTSLTKMVRERLLESYSFIEMAKKRAIESGRAFGTKQQRLDFIEELLQEELSKKGAIPDGPGTLTELMERLNQYFEEQQGDGPRYSQVAKIFGDITGESLNSEIEGFQSGVKRVALATTQKGGVGISLDDRHGEAPRTIVFASPPFSAIETLQAIGRAWRLTTKSDVEVIFVKADHEIDDWGFEIVLKKMDILGATGQSDATKAKGALSSAPIEEGDLSSLERRKGSTRAASEYQQSRKARMEAMRELAPPFYSQLQRTIEQKMPNKALPNHVEALLKTAKKEEIEWSGIQEWLKEQKGAVTKERVLEYLRANDIRIEEVEKGNGDSAAGYEFFTLPGGDNYRELILTLPSDSDKKFQTSHWPGVDNILAHVRFNDRTGANGEKVLHIEEAQSDWHQEGRKKGYKPSEFIRKLSDLSQNELRDMLVANDPNGDYEDVTKEEALDILSGWQEDADFNVEQFLRSKANIDGVPDAPFKTTWHELVMKRMIRYAAENGYDRISWNTAELIPQAEMWKNSSSEINNSPELTKKYGAILKRYSQDIPWFLNKYAKKWGARVETIVVADDAKYTYRPFWESWEVFDEEGVTQDILSTEQEAIELVELRNRELRNKGKKLSYTVHSLPITEAMRESVLYKGQPKFKYADSTARKAVGEANQAMGVTRRDRDRITYAPDGWTPAMELANKVANAVSGAGVIPVNMPSFMNWQGFFEPSNGKVYINKNAEDPVTHVTLHETVHRMKETHPEHYARIEEIALNNLKKEHKELIKWYSKRGYNPDSMPEEFTSDLMAELLHDKTFISKLREQAPEVIKSILDILDEVVAMVKLALGKDNSVLPYIENLEKLQNEMASEYADYLKTVQSDKEAAIDYKERRSKKAKAGQQTNTPEFKKWFGDSKVVDEQGKPLVVYHGTNKDFSVFSGESAGGKTGNPTAGWGFFFTHRPAEASSYATDWTKEGGNVMPVYVSVKNPYIMPYSEYRQFTHLDNLSEGQAGLNRLADLAQQRKKELIEQGYDGIYVMQGDYNGKHIADSVGEIVAFEPTQIKSAYNRGTFDPNNPDINFQEDWRARHKAAMELANKTKSLAALQQAHKIYFEGKASAIQDEEVANEVKEELRETTARLEVLEEVKTNAINFFSERMGPERLSPKTRQDENIWSYLVRTYNLNLNDPNRRELALTPADVLIEGRKGAGFSIDRGAMENAAMEVLQSLDNKKLGPVERLLVKDNIMNMFLLGDIQYREQVNGRPLTFQEKRKHFAAMAHYKSVRNTLDDKVALRLLEELACGQLNDAENSIYKLARMYGGIENRTYHRLLKDFSEVASLLTDEEGVYSDLMEEIVGEIATASHALDVNRFFRDNAENKTENASGFSDAVIKELLDAAEEKLGKLPEGQQKKARNAIKAIVKFHRDILDDLLEGEVITQKTYDTLVEAYPGYMPMLRRLNDRRIIDFDPTKPVQGSASLEGTIEPLIARKGSSRPILDILTSSMESYTRARHAIEMNELLRKFDVIIDALREEGLENSFVKKHKDMPVLREFYAVTEDGTEIPADNLAAEDLEILGVGATLYSKSKDSASYVVAKENGEVILYEAHPEVIMALQTMQKQPDNNMLWKFFRGIGDVLRTGATVTPEFMVKNPIRDAFHGYVTSDSEVHLKNITECAIFMTVGGKKNNPMLEQYWQEFLEDSAGMGNFLNDLVARHNSFEKEITGRKSLEDYNPIIHLQNLSHSTENISRFTEYVKARESGVSRREAAFRSMDQQDFGMAGRWGRYVNPVIPFFNSTIQGKYKLFRRFSENPKEFTYRALLANLPITLVGLALRMLASDDQKRRIEEAHGYIKANYWLIPVPATNTILRIPKPFDTSLLFANTLEAFFEYLMSRDSMTAWDALKGWSSEGFWHSVMPNTVTPQFLNLIAEAQTGFNQFYGMDVVPSSLQDEMAMNQYTANTTNPAIIWGRLMGLIGLGDTKIASPIRVESIINTAAGGLGTLTLDMIDIALVGASKSVDWLFPNADLRTYREKTRGRKPYTEDAFSNVVGVNVDKLPMARVFLQTTDYGKSVNEVYREWERLEKMKKRHDKLMEAGREKEALRAMPDKDWYLYNNLKELVNVEQTFGPTNSLIRDIRDTPHLHPADKGRLIKEFEEDRSRMARETLVFIRLYKKGLTAEELAAQAGRASGMSDDLRAKVKEVDAEFKVLVEQASAEKINREREKAAK